MDSDMSSSAGELDSSSINAVTEVHTSQPACPFLDTLNLDIRVMIYRYLLAGSYNKHEIDAKSQEVREGTCC